MNNRINSLLERLPSHFAKDEDSNNYKLLEIVAENSEENRAVYETILKFWDVDQSQGIGLDRLGKNAGISRGSWNDDEYRKMIKIQSILNLSEGDIPTMNLIMDAYMGEAFLGFQDGWKFFGPATLIANIKDASKPLPSNILKKIKSAGVGAYWLLNQMIGQLHLQVKSYTFDVRYPITNMFTTDALPGINSKISVIVQQKDYTFLATHRITNEFTTGDYESRVTIGAESTLRFAVYDAPFTRLGEHELGGGLRIGGYVDDEETLLDRIIMRTNFNQINVSKYNDLGSMGINADSDSSDVIYKRTNDIYLGEGDL